MSESRLSFTKILYDDNLILDLVEKIMKEYDKRISSSSIIQKYYREYVWEKDMIEMGHTKLKCGGWSNGAQCMCDICYY